MTFKKKNWLLSSNKKLCVNDVRKDNLDYFWSDKINYQEVYFENTDQIVEDCIIFKSNHKLKNQKNNFSDYYRWDTKLGKNPPKFDLTILKKPKFQKIKYYLSIYYRRIKSLYEKNKNINK